MAAQVALKRQQAAEDAMVLNMRAVTTGEEGPYLPQGPIVGLPHDIQGGQETNAQKRIRGWFQSKTFRFDKKEKKRGICPATSAKGVGGLY